MDEKVLIGRFAESFVKNYFLSRGFSLISQNYLIPNIGEIDLILESKNGLTYFIEVRFRSMQIYDQDFEIDRFFSNFKKYKFIRACNFYKFKFSISKDKSVLLIALVTNKVDSSNNFKCCFYDLDSGSLFNI